MSASQVYDNFIWRLESITPTNQIPRKNFSFLDNAELDPAVSTGVIRAFELYWEGSDPDHEPTDMFDRWAFHNFRLEVSYPRQGFRLNDLTKIATDDRDDIVTALRDDRLWTGYNASNTSTDIGLMGRVRGEDGLDPADNDVWILRQQWRCQIQEIE